MILFEYSEYKSCFICIFTAFPNKRKKFLRHMGKRVILFPNESIGCIRIRMLYFTDADFLVLCHCGNRSRINGNPDTVQAQLICIHHMCDPAADRRCLTGIGKPFVNLTFSGFPGRDQQRIRQKIIRLYRIIFRRI